MRFFVRCAAALFFPLIGASSFAPAEEPSAISNQATQTQFATPQGVFNARRHPSYQVFVAQLSLPAITVMNGKTLNVAGQLKMDFNKADNIDAEEKNALAQRLQIPVEFLTALVRKLSTNAQLNGEELAHQFQVEVTDYKYLSEKWARYHPPAGGEPVKQQALNCLQAADLERAWRMFIDLPKPKPPTAVQIISANKRPESR